MSGASASDGAEFSGRGGILADTTRGEIRSERFAKEFTPCAPLERGDALGRPSKLG
jgi:hypothetical protein